ncbi:MAG TPA: hypothetical protein VMJ13_11295 [Candidatus Acidoferrum sp.]|nr:hypothetical protein [Candidatus Acidoferrum sp.]
MSDERPAKLAYRTVRRSPKEGDDLTDDLTEDLTEDQRFEFSCAAESAM